MNLEKFLVRRDFLLAMVNHEDSVGVVGRHGIMCAEPLDIRAAATAHILGPKLSWPAKFSIKTKRGDRLVRAYFRLGFPAPDCDGKTRYFAIDFDNSPAHRYNLVNPLMVAHKTQVAFSDHNMKTYLEVSRSLTGYHLWGLLETPEPVSKVRTLCLQMIPKDAVLHDGNLANPRSGRGIEIFPKTDVLRRNGVGSFLLAPFFWGAEGLASGLISWSGDPTEPPSPIDLIEFTKIKSNYIADIIDRLPMVELGLAKQYVSAHGTTQTRLERFDIDLIEPVFKGCAAMNTLRDDARRGDISHPGGFCLLHMAMQFKGWRKWFGENVPTWGQTEEDRHQIEHSFENKYRPWSCKSLQEKGLCGFSNPEACMKAKVRDGKVFSPSPIRFAFDAEKERNRK